MLRWPLRIFAGKRVAACLGMGFAGLCGVWVFYRDPRSRQNSVPKPRKWLPCTSFHIRWTYILWAYRSGLRLSGFRDFGARGLPTKNPEGFRLQLVYCAPGLLCSLFGISFALWQGAGR